ncbi:PEP-CTERM sorting domain-containing protein [Pseudorhodoferax sp.]|uniref:PEP-CTERM sorting domain-containing protein n=1 Tax=Pseudorhodoferax sp. TaxID=1993553 RepID=UPI002DD6B74D|nr:PEP-CTERM sorting domain-containing protein [Pseudorhodoferax sp.]
MNRNLKCWMAAALLGLAGWSQAAGLVGDEVQITLDAPTGISGDPMPVNLVDLATVASPGLESSAGDGSNVGSFMLPGEFIDFDAYTITVRIGTGAVDTRGQFPGYGADAVYLFESLDIAGEIIIGASITANSGFSNFNAAWLQMLGPDALSLALDTMLFSPGLPDAQTFGELTITLLTRVDENNHVPEPGSLLLAGLALAALRFGGRRAAR